jgi:hypothetical protein
MNPSRRYNVSSVGWWSDLFLIVMVSALWFWIIFDLVTAQRRFGFLDGLWLFLGPPIVWRLISRIVDIRKTRRLDA